MKHLFKFLRIQILKLKYIGEILQYKIIKNDLNFIIKL